MVPLVISCLALFSAPAAAEPSPADALAALAAWTRAQSDGDFAAYGALYDPAFIGIKRTGRGGEQKFTLATWLADRKKMFKAGQKVVVEHPRVAIKGDKVTVRFVQRYQRGSYADHGDKAMVLRAIAGGELKIVREEMRYSAPGWNADPSTEDDATTLVSPISVAVRQQASDLNGACRPVTYTLELTDARHRALTWDIGDGFVEADALSIKLTGDDLSKFGSWCAGGADLFRVIRNGDALVVRHQAQDEATGDDPAPSEDWETRLTVKLPAKAKLK
jgi:ketosteroid isomerase-like protein